MKSWARVSYLHLTSCLGQGVITHLLLQLVSCLILTVNSVTAAFSSCAYAAQNEQHPHAVSTL